MSKLFYISCTSFLLLQDGSDINTIVQEISDRELKIVSRCVTSKHGVQRTPETVCKTHLRAWGVLSTLESGVLRDSAIATSFLRVILNIT